MTPRLFFEKQWLFVKDDAGLATLPELLRAKGIRDFTLVLSPRFRQISDEALAALLERAPLTAPPQLLEMPGSGFLTLLIGECRLQ